MKNINLNSEITIINEQFKCVEIVEYSYEEGSYSEYKLKSTTDSSVYWLEIENEKAYLYESINHKKFDELKTQFSSSESYSGNARVVSFSKNADVDLGETVRFVEFYSNDEQNVISMDTWENGETEYSLGKFVHNYNISVTESYSDNSNFSYSSKKKHNKKAVLIIALVAFIALGSIAMAGMNRNQNCGQFNCSPSNPAPCCTNTDKCTITGKYCNSIKKSKTTRSIRSGSRAFRTFSGGGTSFGK